MMLKRNAQSLFGLAAFVLISMWTVHGLQAWSRDQIGAKVASLASPGDIHMVSSVTCIYCDRARAWFSEYRVPFTECFIERDEACNAQFRALMAPGTPVLVVRDRRLVGFNAKAVVAALEK